MGKTSEQATQRQRHVACKRKEQEQQKERALQPKKQRLVFTDLQRRTLIAIFKENKRPSKEMQVTISQQLGLELNTVSNFFMNARRRCMNRDLCPAAVSGQRRKATALGPDRPHPRLHLPVPVGGDPGLLFLVFGH
ncbi:hypothetical protein CB1_000107007 [Camelus ferus]|nr:hypothetical protein CB1_000107007 [Camelus ferus]